MERREAGVRTRTNPSKTWALNPNLPLHDWKANWWPLTNQSAPGQWQEMTSWPLESPVRKVSAGSAVSTTPGRPFALSTPPKLNCTGNKWPEPWRNTRACVRRATCQSRQVCAEELPKRLISGSAMSRKRPAPLPLPHSLNPELSNPVKMITWREQRSTAATPGPAFVSFSSLWCRIMIVETGKD